MAFEITGTAAPRMLFLRGCGTATSADGHRAFQQIEQHPDYCQGVPILIDVTGLRYEPSLREGRVFAGLFATAFPCSMIAMMCRPGAQYQAAHDIAHAAVDRGATVAAFATRDEALAWLMGRPVADEQPAASVPEPRVRAVLRRVSDGVVIPYALRERIEAAFVKVDGEECPLRLDSAAGRPLEEPDFAELTISADYRGTARLATVDLRVSSLDDEDYVVSTVVSAVQAVLAGTSGAASPTASTARR